MLAVAAAAAVALINRLLTYALPASARCPTATARVWESCTLGSIPVLSLQSVALFHYIHTFPGISTRAHLVYIYIITTTGQDRAAKPPPFGDWSSSCLPSSRPALASFTSHHAMRPRPTGEAVISVASRPPSQRQPASQPAEAGGQTQVALTHQPTSPETIDRRRYRRSGRPGLLAP